MHLPVQPTVEMQNSRNKTTADAVTVAIEAHRTDNSAREIVLFAAATWYNDDVTVYTTTGNGQFTAASPADRRDYDSS